MNAPKHHGAGVLLAVCVAGLVAFPAESWGETFALSEKDRIYVRVHNVDDLGECFVNGDKVANVGYRDDSKWKEITNLLHTGENRIRFRLTNRRGGWTFGFQLRKNESVLWEDACGSAGRKGCTRAATGKVKFDKTIVLNRAASKPAHAPEQVPNPGAQGTAPLERWPFETRDRPLAVRTIDGSTVACTDGSNVHIIALGRGTGRLLKGHQDNVTCLASLPGTDTLYSGSWDGTVRSWDVRTGRSARIEAEEGAKVFSVALRHDGREMAVGLSNGEIAIYELPLRKRKHVARVGSKGIGTLAYRGDGGLLLSGAADGQVVQWDCEDWDAVWKKKLHKGRVTGLAFTRDGRSFYSSGRDGKVLVCDAADGGRRESHEFHEGKSVNGIDLSYDGRHLVTAGSDYRVNAYDIVAGNIVAGFPQVKASRIVAVSFDPAAELLVFAEENRRSWGINFGTVEAIVEIRDLACAFELEATFNDENAFIPNNALDGAETEGYFDVVIRNAGPGTGYATQLGIAVNTTGITFSPRLSIGHIPPGEQMSQRVPVRVDPDVNDGAAQFTFTLDEKRGYDAEPKVYQYQVFRLHKPAFEIAQVVLNDGGGRAQGNDDGQIQNGETIELRVFVKNVGEGPATGVKLSFDVAADGVRVRQREAALGEIATGVTVEGDLVFHIPRDFAGSTVPCTFSVSDRRPGVAFHEERYTPPLDLVAPAMVCEFDFAGAARNGGRTPFTITPRNAGRLAAEDVSIRVLSDTPEATITPNELFVGNVAPGDVGTIMKCEIDLPRSYQEGDISLVAEISQSDYAGARTGSVMPVEIRRPVLKLGWSVTGGDDAIVRKGEHVRVSHIEVQNEGDLDAEQVMLSFDLSPLTVLRRQEVFIGRVVAGGSSKRERFDFGLPRDLRDGDMRLSFSGTQAEFASGDTMQVGELHDPEGPEVLERVPLPLPATPTPGVHSRAGPGGGPSPGSRDAEIAIEGIPESGTVYESSLSGLVVSASHPSGVKNVRAELRHGDYVKPLLARTTSKRLVIVPFSVTGLRPGENEIKLSVQDEHDGWSHKSVWITYEVVAAVQEFIDFRNRSDVDVRIPTGKVDRGHRVAVVIGNRDYDDRDIYSVEYARRDAAAVAAYLEDLMGYDQIRLETDVTLGNLNTLFGSVTESGSGWLGSMVKPGESEVFVYYSGHGAPVSRKDERDDERKDENDDEIWDAYLLPVDCNMRSIASNGYPLDLLYEKLNSLHAKSVSVVIDACFSGGGEKGMLLKRGSPVTVEQRLGATMGPGSLRMTSSSGRQISSWYGPKRHGLFTYYFLKGLQGAADRNRDHRLTLGELDGYVSDRVVTVADSLEGRAQRPIIVGNREKTLIRYR